MIQMAFVCVGIGLIGCGCAASRTWTGPVVEPLTDGGGVVESGMYRDMPYVMASINGHEPMKFLFDTGASLNVLFIEAANDLDIHPVGDASVTGSSGVKKKLPVAFIESLTYGPVVMSDMAFIIQNLGDNDTPYSVKHGLAGIIGVRGLEDLTIDIDYPNRQVAITQERLSFDNLGTSVMHIRGDGLPMVPIRFVDPDMPESDRIIWSLLDSGNANHFDLRTDEAGSLLDQSKVTNGHRTMGIHGIKQLVDVGPVRMEMFIGETQLEGMNAAVSDVENRLDSSTLRNFHVKIDMKSQLVSFTRADNAQRLVSTQRMGITNLWTLDGYRVDQTIEGSAAHLLGMRAFDQVMLIDGVEPSLLHVKAPYWAVESDATTITVRIRRVSDEGWVDIVLPIDGSVEGIEKRERINKKKPGVEVEMTGEDGEVIRGVMMPVDPADVE